MGTNTKLATKARITSLAFLSGSMICFVVRLRPMLIMLPITKTSTDNCASVTRTSVMLVPPWE